MYLHQIPTFKLKVILAKITKPKAWTLQKYQELHKVREVMFKILINSRSRFRRVITITPAQITLNKRTSVRTVWAMREREAKAFKTNSSVMIKNLRLFDHQHIQINQIINREEDASVAQSFDIYKRSSIHIHFSVQIYLNLI